MNVFVLDADHMRAAEMLCLQHLGKMLLESAQLLCTAAPPRAEVPYRRTHQHHPCGRWLETPGAWAGLVAHARALGVRYERVYGRPHKSAAVVEQVASLGPAEPTMPAAFCLAMPAELRTLPSPVAEASPWLAVALYRAYYRRKAREWAVKGRPMRWADEQPAWMSDGAEVVSARGEACPSRS